MTEQAAIGWIFTVVGAGVLWLICGLVVGYFIGGASKMACPDDRPRGCENPWPEIEVPPDADGGVRRA
jgi:hypothetical protein